MGLLSSEAGSPDYNQAMFVADGVALNWNTTSSDTYGIELRVMEKNIIACCKKGEELFSSNSFPRLPGPFKRAGAFCVLGRLYPFFKMIGQEAPQDDKDRHAWLARFMALTVPAVLRRTRSQINGRWITLEDWRGFPSPHYLLEFLAWLRWLDNFERYQAKFLPNEWAAFCMERLARMVMATSLMIEACYYVNPQAPSPSSSVEKVIGLICNDLRSF